MVFTARIDSDTRAKVYYLRNVKGFSTRKVAELCDVSRKSVVRIGRENRDTQVLRLSNRSNDRGRPRKLTSRPIRLLLSSLKSLRIEQGNFTAKRIMEEAGIRESEISISVSDKISQRTWLLLPTSEEKRLNEERRSEKETRFCKIL